MKFRTEPILPDIESVRQVVASTGFFHDYEIDVAVEIVEEYLEKGASCGYRFVFLDDENGNLIAYSSFGEIGCTRKRYDIYWLAVMNTFRGKGIGRKVMLETESQIAAEGGEIAYVETSSREQYLPTRQFYEKLNYTREAEIKDFYDNGDSKVIYSKKIQH